MPSLRDLRAAEARWREVHANVDAIGQALDARNRSYSAKLANLAHVQLRTNAIGQALEIWNRRYSAQLAEVTRAWNWSYSAQLSGLAHVQLQSAAIGRTLDTWNDGVRNQLADLRRVHTIADTIGQALDARNQRFRSQTDAIGQALDAWHRSYSAKLADAARTWNRSHTTQLADLTRAWSQSYTSQLTDLTRVQLRTDLIGQALDAYMDRLHLMAQEVPVARGDREAPVATDALVVPSGSMDWPLVGQYALRILVATITLALAAAIWEEGKDTAPATTTAVIIGVFQAWHAIDEAIWKA